MKVDAKLPRIFKNNECICVWTRVDRDGILDIRKSILLSASEHDNIRIILSKTQHKPTVVQSDFQLDLPYDLVSQNGSAQVSHVKNVSLGGTNLCRGRNQC